MKLLQIVLLTILLPVATVSVTAPPTIADSETTVTLTVTAGLLGIATTSTGQLAVIDQRGSDVGWTISDTTDGTIRTISVF